MSTLFFITSIIFFDLGIIGILIPIVKARKDEVYIDKFSIYLGVLFLLIGIIGLVIAMELG